MILNQDIIQIGTGCTFATAANWVAPLNAACAKFGITQESPLAALLSNVGVESGALTVFVENLNYSAQGLANVWPSRYAVNSQVSPKVPNALALKLARNPQAIANNCYANRNGNGDEASGDGWKFRGHGPIQVTGRANMLDLQNATGMDVVNNPDQLLQPGPGAMSAAWYFATHNCIALANANNFAGVVKAINGQPPCDANHGALRTALYNAALKALYAL